MAIDDTTLLAMLQASGRAGGGQSVRVRGQSFYAIFDNDYTDVLGMVEGTGPALTCRTSDYERLAIAKDDTIDVGDDQWRVKQPKHDGTGMTVIFLRK